MCRKVERTEQPGVGAPWCSLGTLGVNYVLPKLSRPTLNVLPHHHPDPLLFPPSPSLAQTSRSLFPNIIEPLIFAGHMANLMKDYISQPPLQASVAV